jgi:hypothetical protein
MDPTTRVPCPGRLSIIICPPMASMPSRMLRRPRPSVARGSKPGPQSQTSKRSERVVCMSVIQMPVALAACFVAFWAASMQVK